MAHRVASDWNQTSLLFILFTGFLTAPTCSPNPHPLPSALPTRHVQRGQSTALPTPQHGGFGGKGCRLIPWAGLWGRELGMSSIFWVFTYWVTSWWKDGMSWHLGWIDWWAQPQSQSVIRISAFRKVHQNLRALETGWGTGVCLLSTSVFESLFLVLNISVILENLNFPSFSFLIHEMTNLIGLLRDWQEVVRLSFLAQYLISDHMAN